MRRILSTAVNADGTGIDPRNVDPVSKKTSLFVAAETGNAEMFELLVQVGIDEQSISRVGSRCKKQAGKVLMRF